MTTIYIHSAKFITNDGIARVTGLLSIDEFVTLMRDVDNTINPRGAKNNRIVDAVHSTLTIDPELFWLKSKGILLATKHCQTGYNDRLDSVVSASFEDTTTEGVMDGGHTMLAIATYILENFVPEAACKREWGQVKTAWATHYGLIRDRVSEDLASDTSRLGKVRIPFDLIYPEQDTALSYFLSNSTTICGARNSNVQLSEASKIRHEGLCDILEHIVPNPDLFQWKEEQDSGIKLTELISMANVPLSWMSYKGYISGIDKGIADTYFYNSKGAGLKFYKSVLSHPSVSSQENGRLRITNNLVISALKRTKEMLMFFDKMYLMFPKIYNATLFDTPSGKQTYGTFGGTRCCKMQQRKTKYETTRTLSEYNYVDGLIMPLMVACSELLQLSTNGKEIVWLKKPHLLELEDFIKNDRQSELISQLREHNYDPNMFCKKMSTYRSARSIFKAIRQDIERQERKK